MASPPPPIKKYVKKNGGGGGVFVFKFWGLRRSYRGLCFQDTWLCVAGFDIFYDSHHQIVSL